MNSMNCGKGMAIFSLTFFLGTIFTLSEEKVLNQTNQGTTSAAISTIKDLKSSKQNCENNYQGIPIEHLFERKNEIDSKIRSLEFTNESPSDLNTHRKRLKEITKQIDTNLRTNKNKASENGILCNFGGNLCDVE